MLPPVSALQEFLDQSSVIWNAQDGKPAPNSQAALELANFSRPESIATAFSQAAMLFEAATDYSMALIKTLTEPAVAVAPWSCARCILETSALAAWLWDTKIAAIQRAQRSLALVYEGLEQKRKFATIANSDIDPNKVLQQIDEFEKVAQGLGFPAIIDKKNKRSGIARPMPSDTEIVKLMLDKESNYRLLSAMLHGHIWALQSLGFITVKENQNIFESVRGAYFEKHLTYLSIRYLCTEAVTSLSVPILMKFKLFGWDAKTMGSLIAKALKALEK
jgi:hypothetical protein